MSAAVGYNSIPLVWTVQKRRSVMLDGTYLSRNFATLGPLPDSRRVLPHFHFGTAVNLISFILRRRH
jgi:hypothetical protein